MGDQMKTVRIVSDVRTDDPEELLAILRKEGDGMGDHIVNVTLPALGFEGNAKAGGSQAHGHEESDRPCARLHGTERLWREDGQDPA